MVGFQIQTPSESPGLDEANFLVNGFPESGSHRSRFYHRVSHEDHEVFRLKLSLKPLIIANLRYLA